MFPSNTSASHQSHDFVTDLKDWWGTCPLFTKSLIFICTGLCILSHISTGLPTALVNKPALTIGEFEITRLIFSPFVFPRIAELLFGLIVYLPISASQEKEHGTLKAIIDFFLKNLEINLLFIIVCYLLSIISSSFLELEAYGLWCLFFSQIVEKCLENPNASTSFLFPSFHIPNKYYPLVLFLLFSVVSDVIRLDMIVAALAGFLNFRFLNFFYGNLITSDRISSWESSSFIVWLRTLPNYVSHGAMSGPLMADHDKTINPNYPPIGDYGNTPGSPARLDSYGGSGIQIGGENNSKRDYEKMRKDLDDLAGDHEMQ